MGWLLIHLILILFVSYRFKKKTLEMGPNAFRFHIKTLEMGPNTPLASTSVEEERGGCVFSEVGFIHTFSVRLYLFIYFQ